jgi:hypothetical protein
LIGTTSPDNPTTAAVDPVSSLYSPYGVDFHPLDVANFTDSAVYDGAAGTVGAGAGSGIFFGGSAKTGSVELVGVFVA